MWMKSVCRHVAIDIIVYPSLRINAKTRPWSISPEHSFIYQELWLFSIFLNIINKTIDIIIFSETWFLETFKCEIDGYYSYISYRVNKTGGGVSMFIRDGIRSHCTAEEYVISDDIELCVVKLYCGNKNDITIYGIYRPPRASLLNYTNIFHSINQKIRDTPVLFVGDLNVDLLNEKVRTDLANMMFSYNFYPLINMPTRNSENSATCIDHIWSDHNRYF